VQEIHERESDTHVRERQNGDMPILDSDTHLYERRTLWADYADPGDRDKTLRIVDDDLGHAWLMFGDRRIALAEVHHPGDVNSMGEYRRMVRAGEKAEASYDDLLPQAFWDPAARVADLDRFGIDETVVFPTTGSCGNDRSRTTSKRPRSTWARGTGGRSTWRPKAKAACTPSPT